MPTYSTSKTATLPWNYYTTDGGKTWQTDYQTVTISQEILTKPDTVRRVKPVDLFVNSTSREVVSTKNWFVAPGADKTSSSTIYLNGIHGYFNGGINPIGSNANIIVADTNDTKMLNEIKAQKVNLTVSIAELGKTTDMVASFAHDAFGFLRSLRNGRLLDAVNAIKKPRTRSDKALASRWLEYSYGWTPLMFEVHGLSELIYNRIKSEYIHGNVKSTYRYRNNYSSGNDLIRENLVVFRKNDYRYKVSSVGLKTLAESGITNPSLVLWELVPYSFVVDWFVGVGDYLSSLDAMVGVTDFRQIRHARQVSIQEQFIKGGYANATPKLCMSVRDTKRRLASSSTVYRGYPRYEPHVTTTRMMSAVALIRNLFK